MQESSKQIAKNTVLLYVRMGMSLLVSLYTSRIILSTLGINDFGIYSVVGGIVAMVGFLNGAMSGSTSRFLTFELGKGDKRKLSDTFCSALIVHIVIAFIIFLFAETVGLWFLYNKLVIPVERMEAAAFVFQISIITTMLEITQVPYSACIVSHEHFGIYAYIEILNVILRLVCVYLLQVGDWDKLQLFSILTFLSTLLVSIIYRIYCVRSFSECHFRWIYKKEVLLPMLSFSGWDLYGNATMTARHQGMIMFVNIFFGTAVNAAASISLTVQMTISNLVVNILSAFRPQIIKQYAIGNYGAMKRLMLHCCRFLSILFMLLVIPLIFEMPFVMSLWLGDVPNGAIDFARIALITNWIGLINSIFVIPIYASGNIRRYSVITGSIPLVTLVIMYIILELGASAISIFLCMMFSNVAILLSDIILVKMMMRDFPLMLFLRQAFIPILLVLISSLPLFILLNQSLAAGWERLILSIVLSLTIISVLSYFIILDYQQRLMFKSLVISKLKGFEK